jgi:hypothetical protein
VLTWCCLIGRATMLRWTWERKMRGGASGCIMHLVGSWLLWNSRRMSRGRRWTTRWRDPGMPRGCSAVALGRTLVPSQDCWYRSPAVTVHFNSNWFIVLSFKTYHERGFKMLEWVKESRPYFIMRLKVKTKVGAKPARNRRSQIRVRRNSIGASLQESTEMLETGPRCEHQHFITVKTPREGI